MDINRDIATMRAKQMLRKMGSQQKVDQIKNTVDQDKKLKKAADGFEELFVHKMIQVMRDSSFKTNLMSGGRGEEIFQDMLDEQYSKLITQQKTLGLSDMIYKKVKEDNK